MTEKPAVHAPFELENARVIEVGSALDEISGTAGFKELMALLRGEKDASAHRFIQDDKIGKKYARGYLDGVNYLLEEIPALIQRARELKEIEEEAGETFLGTRLGSGSLAG